MSGVPTSQSWGSNPDRSPVALWLNMRISPAYRLPGVGGRLRAAGDVSEITILAEILLHSKCLAGPALAACPVRRGGFAEIAILAQIPLHSKPLPGPALGEAPCGGGGFQKSQYWLKFPSIQNSVPALAESPVRRGRFSEITILDCLQARHVLCLQA